ncbi:uncharacterized protein LOC144094981 [Amblyomma americanum]
MTERPATPCTPCGVQPPSALEGPWQTERVLDLERQLNLEQKHRRKAEKERDKLRILEEIFVALTEKVATMAQEEKHACILMNEMQISPGLDYDASTGCIIGLPGMRKASSCLT